MKIRITNGAGWYRDKVGEIFEVTGRVENYEGHYVNFMGVTNSYFVSDGNYEIVSEETQAPESIVDIIANLTRRVHSLEQLLRDMQNNVERQGVEISANEHSIDELYGRMAHVEADVESNEEDIRTLDERTQTKVMLRSMTEFIERGLKERGVIR